MKDVFMEIGIAVTVILIALLVYGVFVLIQNFIKEQIWTYKYNHRFDKPPLAKCYCKDCFYHGDFGNKNLCRMHNYSTYEEHFCSNAKPLDADTGLKFDEIENYEEKE